MMELMKALEIDNEGQNDDGAIHAAAAEAAEKGADVAIVDKGETEQLSGNEDSKLNKREHPESALSTDPEKLSNELSQ